MSGDVRTIIGMILVLVGLVSIVTGVVIFAGATAALIITGILFVIIGGVMVEP